MRLYKGLTEKSRRIGLYGSLEYLLEWDMQTQMPEGGISLRSQQKELIAILQHKEQTSSHFGKQLGMLIDLETGEIKGRGLNDGSKANLKRWRHDYLKAKKLPGSFVKKLAKTSAESQHAWDSAKKSNSFKEFAPHLKKVIDLMRKKADYLGYDDHPYDALIDLYEPGMKTREMDAIFEELRPPLLKMVANATDVDTAFLRGTFKKEKQFKFTQELLKRMGLTEDMSRIDISTHPFCLALSPTDVRLTTRIDESSFMENISAMMHEGGHGLYEAGLDPAHFGTPLGTHCSIAHHEGQSKFWETCIGLSRPFWDYTYPQLQKIFPEKLGTVTLNHFYQAITQVKPTMIRILSDEVTYPLHIMLRFEMEKALIEGSLDVNDIPDVWNEKMKTYLNLEPQTYSEGCLQDIHWSAGYFGYFPTYVLGNLYAAQLFNTLKTTHPDWDKKLAEGDLLFAKEFLNHAIHRHGRRYSPSELIKQATQSALSPGHFVEYLESKY